MIKYIKFAYKSLIVLFLIAQKSHYIKYDILKIKISRNNDVGGTHDMLIHIILKLYNFRLVWYFKMGFSAFWFSHSRRVSKMFLKIRKTFKGWKHPNQ